MDTMTAILGWFGVLGLFFGLLSFIADWLKRNYHA